MPIPKFRPNVRVVSVSCAINDEEIERINVDAKDEDVSIYDLCRERVIAPIPFEDWAEAAKTAINSKEEIVQIQKEDRARKANLRKQIQNEAKELSNQTGKPIEEVISEIQAMRGIASPKREHKAVVKLTSYEATELRWKAYCLNMTISSIMRKILIGYIPGGYDDRSIPWDTNLKTKANRTQMLQAVMEVCEEGAIPACTELFYCKSCGKPIDPKTRS